MSETMNVVIAGAGIAGLESLIALRDLAEERVAITLVAPDPEFTYKPLIVQEPFSFTAAERRALAPIAEEFGARFVQRGVTSVRPDESVVELDDASTLPYDAAIVCIGARPRSALSGAATLRPDAEPPEMDDLLRRADSHPARRMAFVVPPGVSWPLPIYELAMLGDRRARQLGLAVRPVVVTPESAPLIMFGPEASAEVASLLRAREIEVRPGAYAADTDGGGLVLTPGGEHLDVGAAIALPALEGPAVPGLPADDAGFIPIDDQARVKGTDGVYAAGDGTNFPIKQGGIATQQADAAAEDIAAGAGADVDPRPFHPILRGKLITGEETISMRADLTGGAGEGEASLDYLWWPPHKVHGRYLAPWLAGESVHLDPEPPRDPIEVEVVLPREWHSEPMNLDPYGPLGID